MSPVARPVVTFLSDFGSSDPFVGICHGVIVRTCPEAEVIHLAHGIDPQSVGQGARVLAASVPVPAGGRAHGGGRPRRRFPAAGGVPAKR